MAKPSTKRKVTQVTLPFAEAIEKAARLNFLRDVRVEKKFGESAWERFKDIYIGEVVYLFAKCGKNYEPDAPDVEHIYVREDAEWLALKKQYSNSGLFDKILEILNDRSTAQAA